jgi:hypothetical protein
MCNWLSWCNILYALICREINIQSDFSFKFWVQYCSMEIEGRGMLELISNGRDQAYLSCPDRAQSPKSRGSGSHHQRLYNEHVNQGSLLPENRTLLKGSDPLWHRSGGMHHCFTSFSSTPVPSLVRVRQPALRYENFLVAL